MLFRSRSYVEQQGAPALSVRASCSGDATTVGLNQGRFTGGPDAPAPPAQTWTLPVCLKPLPASPAQCQVVDRAQQSLSLKGCAANVFANPDARGYYFSEYTPEGVKALARTARTALTPVERVSLLGDEWWMVRGGRHDIGVYLDLGGALATDDTSAVIDAIAGRLTTTGEYKIGRAHV